MAGYTPLKITGMTTGLVEQREEFLLPDDAYPNLTNAYIFRERILRKKGYQLLGRLQRNFTDAVLGNTGGGGNIPRNLITVFSLESTSQIVPGSVIAKVAATAGPPPSPEQIYTDDGAGVLVSSGIGTGTINYATGDISITGSNIVSAVTVSFGYYPGLPVMGIRTEEIQNSENDQTIFFDQKYAYVFNSTTNQFQEFIAGTTWNAHNGDVSATDFFWSTNWWVSSLTIPTTATPFFTTSNVKLFWVTNNTGVFGASSDPIRISDGVSWVDFSPPNFGQIDSTNFLLQCLSFLPFRGRLLAFNTWEGPDYASGVNYFNRIRWSTIGNPFLPYSAGPPAQGSWRDDIRGQGGYLDIPTSEDIIAVGFVRDNLVIYTERSTWQLRYTGRSIAPFQIERVNSELGAEGPFSAVQFDTSLLGIGDKGIVECDSYKSERIDIKIPDLVWGFRSENNGPFRVHGIRDFLNRLAYWTFPAASYSPVPGDSTSAIFPSNRLVYNYENDSWAIFTDSLTCLGVYQPTLNRTWLNTPIPWKQCDFSWVEQIDSEDIVIVGGNQQGFVEYLDQLTTNDVSLYISGIQGNAVIGASLQLIGTSTVITCPNHNMVTGFVIGISGIPTGTPFDNLNGGVFGVVVIDVNSFELNVYDAATMQFSAPQLDLTGQVYIGGGLIDIRDNFSIVSKKFNFLDEGQNIQMGYVDLLMTATESENPGAISMNVYLDYNDEDVSNTLPLNQINNGNQTPEPDTFFNSVIPTTSSTLNQVGGTKFWQRVYCATRASFLTIEYTFSNAQMAGGEQELDVEIDAQILWIRKAGRISQI